MPLNDFLFCSVCECVCMINSTYIGVGCTFYIDGGGGRLNWGVIQYSFSNARYLTSECCLNWHVCVHILDIHLHNVHLSVSIYLPTYTYEGFKCVK